MKKTYYLNYLLNLLYFVCLKPLSVSSMDYTNCNKLWGITQDANGKMLYKVGMYMCVEDPYNIYKSSGMPLPISPNNLLLAPPTSDLNMSNNITNNNITNNNITNISGVKNFTISPKSENKSINDTSFLDENFDNTTNKNISNKTTRFFMSTTTLSPHTETITTIPETTTKNINVNKNISTISSKTNKTNATLGYTNLRSSNSIQSISTKQDNIDIVLIVVIVSVVVVVIISTCGFIYWKHNKSKKIVNQKTKEQETKEETYPPKPEKPEIKQRQIHNKPKINPRQIPPNNKVFPGKNNINLNVDTNKGRELKLNHEVLTPNTRQILNESEASIKKWYKKTFHDELNQCSNDVPMPPISNTEPIHIPQKNQPSNVPNLKNNVKKLINIKEMEIKRNQPQHNTQNYQIQYMNRGNRKHNTNRKHFAQ